MQVTARHTEEQQNDYATFGKQNAIMSFYKPLLPTSPKLGCENQGASWLVQRRQHDQSVHVCKGRPPPVVNNPTIQQAVWKRATRFREECRKTASFYLCGKSYTSQQLEEPRPAISTVSGSTLPL
eukprot:4928936-Amphidinium_carterae.1